jgi:hypothetical protein
VHTEVWKGIQTEGTAQVTSECKAKNMKLTCPCVGSGWQGRETQVRRWEF